MRLTLVDVWTRLKISLSRYMAPGLTNGVMVFGENNDYPQLTERIINNSVTAKRCADILSSFLVGYGYNPEINKIVVGTDIRGKGVTVYDLMSLLAHDLAYHNGCYVHVANNMLGEIVRLSHVPFKNCRFEKLDDEGYTSRILVYDKWERYNEFKRDRIKVFPIYSSNEEIFLKRVEAAGGFEKFTGQIDFFFTDSTYLYPLSNIDSIFHDADAEFGVSLFRNNIFRNGILGKVIITVAPMANDDERLKLKEKISNLISADGDPVVILEDEIGPNGELAKSLRVDKIDTNISAEIFEKLEPALANRIRKAFYGLPAVLIDYEASKLGTTSGEAIIQAVNYYNAITEQLRTRFGSWLAELLQEIDNPTLQANEDWTIKPLKLWPSNS